MRKLFLFLRDGKLFYGSSLEDVTAFEVVNPEELAACMAIDQLCDLPKGWTVEIKGQYWTGSPLTKNSRLPEWIDIDNGMTIYEGLETRKIARLIPASKVSDSPVIPEGSEKQKYEVLLYGEWVELSENQYLMAINNNHYGRINGVEQHRKVADKQAIDDTLKGRWIRTKDQIPGDFNLVIVCMTSGAITVGRRLRTNNWGIFTSSGIDIESQTNHVEYWQPLPASPAKQFEP